MEELKNILKEHLNETLLVFVLSGRRKQEGPSKIKVRPVLKQDRLMFQTAIPEGKKEIHKNYDKKELIEEILVWVQEFRQLQIGTTQWEITVLISKKGKMTIKKKKQDRIISEACLTHNRRKHYLIEEGHPVSFMVDLGVMTPTGKVVQAKYDKFRQINRFLEFIEDVLPRIEHKKELTILDFGCGKSYLTFAVYYFLRIKKGLNVHMVGLDLKKDVIETCSALAEKYEYDQLTFQVGDIGSYEGTDQIDMVITLHACDTATDYALEKAVKWNAEVILSVPCCQHELNKQIDCPEMKPVLKYGLVKERIASLLTDAFRAGSLEEAGYQVQILEFIDMEHTPKNILIRAVKGETKKISNDLHECMKYWGVRPTLSKILETEGKEAL